MSFRPFLLASLGLPALFAQAPLPSAQEVLTKAKAAMGGAAWDKATHLAFRGKLNTSGLKGSLEELESLRDGQSRSNYDLGSAKGAQGFDGKASWSQDQTGDVRVEPVEAPAGRNYMTLRAYWFPDRCKATISHLGLQEGHFHVLKIKPEGADAFELWVNGQTWLLDRVVTTSGDEMGSTFFKDYRDVAGLKLPFQIHTPKTAPAQDTLIEYEIITVNPLLAPEALARPIQRLSDFGMEGGRTLATVPLEFLGDHLFVMAMVNGKGPFRFFLDTGGVNILTPSMAKTLGLASTGSVEGHGIGEKTEAFGLAKIDRIQVGEAWMKNQSFYVIPSLEKISQMMGLDVAGVLGYELLRRFVAHVEYGPRRLTLITPEGWRYSGKGVAVPFTFNGHHPRMKGELNGIPGLFDIDTGSGATLDVYAPFASKHRMKEKARVSFETVTGQGAGGAATGDMIRGRELKLGGVSMKAPIVALSNNRAGAFADETGAGNVGQGFLSRFDLTFDYTAQIIYFEPNADQGLPDRWNMTGFRLDAEDQTQVAQIFPDSPAQKAGIKVGDHILSVNNEPMVHWTKMEGRDRMKSLQPGTRLELQIRSGDQERHVSLLLKELL